MGDSDKVNTFALSDRSNESRETDHGVLTQRILMSGMVKSHHSLLNPEHNQRKEINDFDYEGHKRKLDEKVSKFRKRTYSDDVNKVVQQIIEILTAKRYRRGPKKNFEVARSDYEERLGKSVSKKEKLLLILPSFPVKCWNPLKVERKMPDLAEIQCISRLYLLCKEIEHVYEPGAKVILIADVPIYAPIFAEPLNVALQYKSEVIGFINKLNIGQYIIMGDMIDLIAQFSSEFEVAKRNAKIQVETFWHENPNDKHRIMLLENTHSNINLTAYSKEILRAIFFNTPYIRSDELDIAKDEITRQTNKSALEYAILLQAINSMELIMKCYPDGIRVTCHPKPGQLGLHLLSPKSCFNFPWNGVGVLKKNGDIRVSLEDEVKRDKRYVAVYIKNDSFPFYYEEQ
ncbi:10859_t:CDS:2 [Scutellospora calospora]|uniref:10859_t:CDS:1 n=1 Tax=Scutellospora calospora TaxID=85575 RepID=A0ACA9K7T3_9GLOM|nr:10859_t:CDS:2 [Scutellospora calospora]